MELTISLQLIAEVGAAAAVVVGVWRGVRALSKWLDAQTQQSNDIEALRAKEEQDIQGIKDEMCLLTYGLLACLDGLNQLGANGEVTTARAKLEKHINQQAHGQK